jgi:hypothetical protein
MRILFEGTVMVAYHILSVQSGGIYSAEDSLDRRGQWNGLCGAGVQGFLSLIAAPHSADIPVRVELHDKRPPIDPRWEEVVEVSFTPASDEVYLEGWEGPGYPLDLPVQSYRVRYHLDQMDEDDLQEQKPAWHPHVLQFWPAPPARDKVLRVTSRSAAYWHAHARKLPPPPTPEEVAEVERKKVEQRRKQEEEWRRRDEERSWGGRVPTPRLREIGGQAAQLAELDRALVDALEAAAPDVQRAIARWAAHRACDMAGISERPWVAAGLAAMDRGAALPPPFDDRRAASDKLLEGLGDGKVYKTFSIIVPLGDESPAERISSSNFSKPHAAVPAVFAAVESDPLRAACDAVWAAIATAGADHPAFVTKCREFLAAGAHR